jgi:hypothetical protein
VRQADAEADRQVEPAGDDRDRDRQRQDGWDRLVGQDGTEVVAGGKRVG